jgi:hypothetical protein
MDKDKFLIDKIFKTFFKGVEYGIELEKSHNYLYNICLTNLKRLYFNPSSFTPEFSFENTDNRYDEDEFAFIFRNFAPTLSGLILIYYVKKDLGSRIILTPNQIKNENYGIIARITDPYTNRFS